MKSALPSVLTRYALPVAMLVLACVGRLAWAENWVFLRNSSGANIYLDTDAIRILGAIPGIPPEVEFTVKYTFPTEQVHEGLHYRNQLHHMIINCQTRMVEQEGLDILNANGEVARSWHVFDGAKFSPPTYVPPGSHGDQEVAIVCAR